MSRFEIGKRECKGNPPPRSSSAPKTTYKGKSSFQTHSDFLQWETFVGEQLAALPQSSTLQRGFQTCEHWKQIFMEIIGEYMNAMHDRANE